MTPAAIRLRIAAPALALVAVVAAAGCGEGSRAGRHTPDYSRMVADAPAPLARVYAHGDRLLGGGTDGFDATLRSLRGHPVVVNKWASWCGPCRVEAPYFQRLAARYGDRVAFLGVDANDDAASARTFLREFPLPYPSFADPQQDVADVVTDGRTGFPATAFYDTAGTRVDVHLGQYASARDLAADIRRYALDGGGAAGG